MLGAWRIGPGARHAWQPRNALRLRLGSVVLVLAAASGGGGAAPACAEWSVAGYVGAATTAPADVTLRDAGAPALVFEQVSFEGRSFEPPLYYGVRVGFGASGRRGLSVEGELIHLKAYARVGSPRESVGAGGGSAGVEMHDVVQRFAMSHGMNLLLANVVWRQPIPAAGRRDGRLRLVARVGIGAAVPHAESTVRGRSQEQYDLGGPGLQTGGGVEWDLGARVFLLGEYKYTRASPRVGVAGGEIETRIASHHGVFGLGWAF